MDNSVLKNIDFDGWRKLPTETLGKLLTVPGLDDNGKNVIMDELDDRKYDEHPVGCDCRSCEPEPVDEEERFIHED